MEVDHALAPAGPSFWGQDSDDSNFWEEALVNVGLLDDEATCGFSESLEEFVVGDNSLPLECENFGLQDAEAIQEEAILWDADFLEPHRKLEGDSKGNQSIEEWLATETPGAVLCDGSLPAFVADTQIHEAQSGGEGYSTCMKEEAVDQSAADTKSLPELKIESTSMPVTPGEEDTRGRKRSREAVDSLETFGSPGPEPLVVNSKDARELLSGETSDVDVSRSRSKSVSTPEGGGDGDTRRRLRLEKNRESASQSRARKKSYVKDLEVKCRMLEAHVAQLQRVMNVTTMENAALKDELVRVKKSKDGVKSGVAEPAVLESNSLPLEFLPHHSYHYPTGQQCSTAGRFQRFLLALLQLLLLAAVSGPGDPQASLPRLHEDRSSCGFWRYPDSVGDFTPQGSGLAARQNFWRRKKTQHVFDCGDTRGSRPPQWRLHRRTGVGSSWRRVKCLRSSRIM